MKYQRFYIGQKVVAVRNHSQGYFTKGQVFTVMAVKPKFCSCPGFLVDVGMTSTTCLTECATCSETSDNGGKFWFHEDCFAPVQELRPPFMTFSKIKEVEVTEVLIDN